MFILEAFIVFVLPLAAEGATLANQLAASCNCHTPAGNSQSRESPSRKNHKGWPESGPTKSRVFEHKFQLGLRRVQDRTDSRVKPSCSEWEPSHQKMHVLR